MQFPKFIIVFDRLEVRQFLKLNSPKQHGLNALLSMYGTPEGKLYIQQNSEIKILTSELE
ncbi:hypothetical protein H6H01_05510 [Nostoc calcicola FACHB-3891]|nr:hypothetical protein [Nostoc calcicola FACHB-3891]MDZ8062946.1 hypothetical protein [Nostoc sp. EkiNYC01]